MTIKGKQRNVKAKKKKENKNNFPKHFEVLCSKKRSL